MTLYVTDLDGTLLSDCGKLRPRAADMLNRFIEGGLLFSYCTARRLNTAEKAVDGLKMQTPVIVMGGALIYDPVTKEYPVRNIFDEKQTALMKQVVTENNETPMIFSIYEGSDRVSFLKDSPSLKKHLASRKGDKQMRPAESYDDMFLGEIFYVSFINPVCKAALDKVFTKENGFLTMYYTDNYDESMHWYEVCSSEAGKANAVRKLKELTGADELVCFGDNLNDLAMFGAADRCYAVGNAVPELKKAATGIILSNEEYGVPVFIEKELFPAVGYIPPKGLTPSRFEESVRKALSRSKSTIGTLNEKIIHNTLKCYYCDEEGHEAKLGTMYADGISESGIFEIQSANFNYLAKKLMFMLSASHVTVVYPFEKKTRSFAVNSQTGEIMSVTSHTENSYSGLFLELYRLKAFITNPNLTIRIAFLEIDKKLYYKDERRIRRKGMKREKIPTALTKEIVLDKPEDYRVFLPDGLPERFTKTEFGKLCRPTDAGIMLSVLEFTGVIRRCGKRGTAIEYTLT